MQARPMRHTSRVDWNLRTCARKGHITYQPTETVYAAKLLAETPHGDAWRCLRCGNFVLGEPHGAGPAEDAPIVLRGPVLRDAFILRILAVERLVRGSLFVLLSFAVHRFSTAQDSLKKLFDEDLPAAKPLADKLGIDLQGNFIVKHLRSSLETRHGTLTVITLFLLIYGIVQMVEGVGLWMLKRWGEYVAVVATSAFIPLEIYELYERITVVRVGALVFNLAAMVYLVYSKRLFGARGGHAAYEKERHAEALLEVQDSAA